MWTEIDAQRAQVGDSNDCRARVNGVPTSGGVTLQPGDDINAALRSNVVVFLKGGTYRISQPITIEASKKLIGVAGQTVTIDASAVKMAVVLRDYAVLANVNIRDADDIGVYIYQGNPDRGSTGALMYRVSVGRTGLNNPSSSFGNGILMTDSGTRNCVVSTEVFDSWNENGSGGNADGYKLAFGSNHNTVIDSYGYRNGDDGIDMWEGGVAFVYHSAFNDNGKTTGKPQTGDGNGLKLGVGSVSHKLFKVQANYNRTRGFNLNGNTVQPTLVQCSATGNGSANYAGVNAP
jgi:hypothetical protein